MQVSLNFMDALNLSNLFVQNPELIAADMDGQTVMMSIAHGEYFGLDGIGSQIWKWLAQPVSIDQLVSTICTEYAVDEVTCRTDLEQFISELMAKGLVQQA